MVMKMFIPAYTQTDAVLTAYDSISHSARLIIYNANSGPGTMAITSITESMTDNHANGGLNFCYVNTADQVKSIANVETEIDSWNTFYGSLVDGIYFDNVKRPSSTSWTNYYSTLAAYDTTLALKSMWGVGSDGSHTNAVDVNFSSGGAYILLFEVAQGTAEANYPSSSNVPSWLTTALAPFMCAALVKKAGGNAPVQDDLEDFADSCKVNLIYNAFITDQTTYSIQSGLLAAANTYLATI